MAEIFNFYVQDNRTIQFPKNNLLEPIMQEDNNVAVWRFRIPKTLNSIDMSGWAWWFVYVNATGQDFSELLTLVDDIDEPDSFCTADYSIDYGISYHPGNFQFSLEAINADSGGEVLNEWHTKTYAHKVDKTLQGNQAQWAETESDIISALIVEVQNKVAQLVGGATPEPVSLIADMTDTKKVYLYVGSETGESTNYWYYYNGSAWVAGGLYASGITVDATPTQGSTNAVSSGGVWSALQNIDVTTDTTLSVPGKPADAKAVGDALADIDVETDTTLTISGKPADAKTVGDAVEKTVTTYDEAEYTGNLVDNTNARLNGQWVLDLRMFHPVDGVYYSNPLVGTIGFANAQPYDSDGNDISFVGSTVTNIRIGESGCVFKWEISNQTSITVTSYTSLANFNNNIVKTKTTYTLSAIPEYWVISGKAVAYPATSTDADHGITVEPSETYVAYVEPIITHGYRYADELDEHVADIVSEELGGLNNATSEDIGKTPKIKTVVNGTVIEWDFDNEDNFEPSYNLIDESQFNWTSVGGYWYLKDGYYFHVTAGKKICTNAAKPAFRFYDATYTQIGQTGTNNPYAFVDIPTGAVWCRMHIQEAANTLSDIQGKLIVYEANATVPSNDDIREYVPPTKIIGNLVEGDIYDTALPKTINLDILTASQYRAVRAVNKMRNAFRIATFNIYVRMAQYGWGALKQELKDYSVDICAMQEVSNSAVSSRNRFVQNYLTMNTWQFKYGSQAVFNDVLTGKAVVSMYEIVSTEHFYNSTQGREYIKTVINLPQYKQSLHQFTLSVYSYHGDLLAANRLIEVSEILATIANDTSDFIVVCGDTNAFASEADEHGKRPTWEAWINGGFTPIHYGEHRTVTADDDTNSIDQIFMGQNVSCANYDIVNSKDYMVEDGAGNLVPISDHCMVYADLIFDFDAVLKTLNT